MTATAPASEYYLEVAQTERDYYAGKWFDECKHVFDILIRAKTTPPAILEMLAKYNIEPGEFLQGEADLNFSNPLRYDFQWAVGDISLFETDDKINDDLFRGWVIDNLRRHRADVDRSVLSYCELA